MPWAQAVTTELQIRGSLRFVEEMGHGLCALADRSSRGVGVITRRLAATDAAVAFAVTSYLTASGDDLPRR
ncbi:hypothetical protein [Kineococcus aurantiacus]|uniref:hypothetical protein n=1 Tax=Kineococcus aurantiacus TaxID=37633 RepID=UPI0031D4248C